MHFVVVQNEYDNFVVHIFFEISFFSSLSCIFVILTNGRTEIMQRRGTFSISELASELKADLNCFKSMLEMISSQNFEYCIYKMIMYH